MQVSVEVTSGLERRLTMGVPAEKLPLMGYLALYGGLWSAIIFHFVNNTTYHLIGLTWGTEDLFDSQNTTQVIILMIVAVAASVGIWKLIKRIKQSSQDATAIESIDYE